jgi:hypothetical protein
MSSKNPAACDRQLILQDQIVHEYLLLIYRNGTELFYRGEAVNKNCYFTTILNNFMTAAGTGSSNLN